MFIIAISFLAGNVIIQYFSELPSAIVLLALPLLYIFRNQSQWQRITAAFCAGFLITWFAAYLHLQNIKDFSGGRFQAVVQIDSIPIWAATHWRFDASVITADHSIPSKIRLSIYDKSTVPEIGDKLSGKLYLKPIHGSLNPGGFDYEKHMFMHRIGAKGYIKNIERIEKGQTLLNRWRYYFYQQLVRQSEDAKHSGLLLALTMGERGKMRPLHWDLLKATGVGHLFAISGLHIGLIFGFFFILIRYLWTRFFLCRFGFPSGIIASLSALPFAGLYAWFAGFTIPTQRAIIMLACVVIGKYFMHHPSVVYNLAFAIIIVLILDPLSTLSVSFWFSFLAVAAIALYISSYSLTRRQWWGICIYIPIALLPISLLFFQHGSLVAPLANLVAIPYISFIVLPICFLATIFVPISESISSLLITVADNLFELFMLSASYIKTFNIFQWFHRPPIWAYIPAVVGAIALVVLTGVRKKLLAMILLLSLTATPDEVIKHGAFQAQFLDVGQGLSVVIHTRRHTLVFDAGAAYASGFDLGKAVVVPYLHYKNINHLDALIISHSDNDHSGGAKSILDSFSAKDKYLGGGDTKIGFRSCQYGMQWNWDGINFKFLYPFKDTQLKGNDASCVLKVENAQHSLLIASDIEKVAENDLISRIPEALKNHVMLVPHHGSLTSSTDQFVDQSNPNIAIISSGYQNRFSFPKAEVVARYQQIGAKIYNTATSGAIQVDFETSGQINISQYRQIHKKYWHTN